MEKDYDFEQEKRFLYTKRLASHVHREITQQHQKVAKYMNDIMSCTRPMRNVEDIEEVLKAFKTINYNVYQFRQLITKLKKTRREIKLHEPRGRITSS